MKDRKNSKVVEGTTKIDRSIKSWEKALNRRRIDESKFDKGLKKIDKLMEN